MCVPKTHNPTHPEGYRPLTVMNTDFNLLSRIITNRLRTWPDDLINRSKHFGLYGNNILGSIAVIRETVALAELTGTPTYIFSLDFKEAFDNIAGHFYLFAVLQKYGFSKTFQHRIRRMYVRATSHVQVNGYISKPIHINCSVRQGCPLSMLLSMTCLHPLLYLLNEKLASPSSRDPICRPAVIVYADDITVILRSPDDVAILQETSDRYTEASGANLIVAKSRQWPWAPGTLRMA